MANFHGHTYIILEFMHFDTLSNAYFREIIILTATWRRHQRGKYPTITPKIILCYAHFPVGHPGKFWYCGNILQRATWFLSVKACLNRTSDKFDLCDL